MTEISLSVKAKTADELRSSVVDLAAIMGGNEFSLNVADPHVSQAADQTPVAPVEAQPVTPVPAPVQQPAPTAAVPVAPSSAAPVQPNPAPASAPNPAAPVVPTNAPAYTFDQLAAAAAPLMDAGKGPQLIEALQTFGVDALTALSPDQYGAFAVKMRELGAKI